MAQGSRRRGRIFIYVALIIVLAVVLVYALLKNGFGLTSPQTAATPPASAEEMTSIVVVTQPLERGTVFTPNVLTTIPYPKQDLVEGTFFTNVNDVVGKVARFDMDARVPVTTTMIADVTTGSFAAFQIPKGMVAISIPITRLSSVSYALQAGDHVNVISTVLFVDLDTNFQSRMPNQTANVLAPGTGGETGRNNLTAEVKSGGNGSEQGRAEQDPTLVQPLYLVPSESQRPRMVSQTLLQDAIVLQVGNFQAPTPAQPVNQPTPTPTPGGAQQGQPAQQVSQTQTNPDVITLVVTPQDAVTLNYLIYSGAKLTLALRGAGDDQRVQTEAVTLQYLMDQYNIPVPAKLPYGMEPRVDVLSAPQLPNDVTVVSPK